MWNLKSTKTTIVAAPVQKVATQSNIDVNALIEQIHREFDEATEKILNDAVTSLKVLEEKDTSKGDRLGKLGFSKAKHVESARVARFDKVNLEALSIRVMYYQTNYPNNKFITEDVVKKICEKYRLVFGYANFYIGDVPEKNIAEMERFELRDEDHFRYQMQGGGDGKRKCYYAPSVWRGGATEMCFIYEEDETIKIDGDFVIRKEPFKICATYSDFDTKEMKIEDGYKLKMNLPDPVVLQPVPGGYLIVTKWGLEGNDESLTNEKMN
jgi:hypothetical protein